MAEEGRLSQKIDFRLRKFLSEVTFQIPLHAVAMMDPFAPAFSSLTRC
jgi:hypothetical protein